MKRIALLGWLLCLGLPAAALEVNGVKLDDTRQVAGQSLVLNGAGVRTKWFFKVYVGALYLTTRQSSADMVIADEHPLRIELHLLRELSGKKLYGAFNEAIQANHDGRELSAMHDALRQMAAIFDAVGKTQKGDVVALDYQPGTGTQVVVNGKVYGVIAGAQFKRALLKIWLGGKPAQEDLKKAMLGG